MMMMIFGVKNTNNNVMSSSTTTMMFLSSVLTLLSLKTNSVSCDIFSSTSHLQNLMYLERHIVTQMYNYVDEMEDKLNQVKRWVVLLNHLDRQPEVQKKWQKVKWVNHYLEVKLTSKCQEWEETTLFSPWSSCLFMWQRMECHVFDNKKKG